MNVILIGNVIMSKVFKSISPLNTPVGTPVQWYSPINTPMGTPRGEEQSQIAQQERLHSVESATSHHPHPSSAVNGSYVTDDTDTATERTDTDTDKLLDENTTNEPEEEESSPRYAKQEEKSSPPQKFPFSKTQMFTIVILAISSVCSAMFGSLIAPFYPIQAKQKGMSETWIGFLFGSYQLIGFVLSPVFGAYLMQIGAKFMYVSGIFVTSSCAILFGTLVWCPPGIVYIVMCFLCRTVEAVGSAGVGTASRAIATYTFPQHVSTVTGILNACGCVGLMIGPPIGGVLFEAGGYLFHSGAFFLPFLVTGCSFMLCAGIAWCLLPSPTGDSLAAKKHSSSIPKWHLLKVPIIPVMGYLVFTGQFAMGLIDVTFSLHLKIVESSLSYGYIGLIFLIAPLVVVLFAPLLGYFADKFKIVTRPILITGVFLASLGFLGLGPSPFLSSIVPPYSLGAILGSLAIAGVGWAALVITYDEFVNAARKKGFADSLETQGLVSGIYNAFNNLGAFIGPVAGGFMNERLGFPWTSTITAIMIGSAGVILLLFYILELCCCRQAPVSTVMAADGKNQSEPTTSQHFTHSDQSQSSNHRNSVLNHESEEYVIRDNEVYKDPVS